MTRPILVVGSSGHAKAVLDAIEAQNHYRVVGLIDSFKAAGSEVFGYRVLGTETDIPGIIADHHVEGCFVAIGDNWVRGSTSQRIAGIAPTIEFVTVVHPRAYVGRGAVLGSGTVLLAGVVVSCDSVVGRLCLLNTSSSLDHDSRMEDLSSLAPHAATGS